MHRLINLHLKENDYNLALKVSEDLIDKFKENEVNFNKYIFKTRF
jgi:hypothetical protein